MYGIACHRSQVQQDISTHHQVHSRIEKRRNSNYLIFYLRGMINFSFFMLKRSDPHWGKIFIISTFHLTNTGLRRDLRQDEDKTRQKVYDYCLVAEWHPAADCWRVRSRQSAGTRPTCGRLRDWGVVGRKNSVSWDVKPESCDDTLIKRWVPTVGCCVRGERK